LLMIQPRSHGVSNASATIHTKDRFDFPHLTIPAHVLRCVTWIQQRSVRWSPRNAQSADISFCATSITVRLCRSRNASRLSVHRVTGRNSLNLFRIQEKRYEYFWVAIRLEAEWNYWKVRRLLFLLGIIPLTPVKG
jgi:hypothetical protein